MKKSSVYYQVTFVKYVLRKKKKKSEPPKRIHIEGGMVREN